MADRFLDDPSAARLLELARAAVAEAAQSGRAPSVDLPAEPGPLQQDGATFVTLRTRGLPDAQSLRGCIGSVQPSRPLALDVVQNAAAAALRDPRFPPVGPAEVAALDVSVSVLSPFTRVPAEDDAAFLAALRPGVDGLLIRDGGRRGVFLPQVWEQLPTPEAFLGALRRKAGLAPGERTSAFQAWRFTVQHVP